MERSYESASALVGRAAGPLSQHLFSLCMSNSLIRQQYIAGRRLRQGDACSVVRWLAGTAAHCI